MEKSLDMATAAPVKLEIELDSESEAKELKVSCYSCLQKLDLTSLEPFSYCPCPACGSILIVPQWFGTYLLEEMCGEGGMAKVYRTLDVTLDREVAIKVMKPELASVDNFGEIFLQEARIAASLNHHGIVPIYSCGEIDSQPYFVMQFMANGTVEHYLNNHKDDLTLPQIVRWLTSVAEGLENAKKHGIIHHDVKTGNILLDTDVNAKIGDFGIAQAIFDAKSSALSHLTRDWGSPHYVSPEKLISGHEDYRGDIFSLGVVFYELVTGKMPFKNSSSTEELLRVRKERRFTEPQHYRSEITPELTALMLKMLEYEPDMRPAYPDIIKTMHHYLRHISLSAKTVVAKQHWSDWLLNWKFYTAAVLALALMVTAVIVFHPKNRGPQQPKNQVTVPNYTDLLPNITKSMASGDSAQAAIMAAIELENIRANVAQRKQAAVFTALCAYLNYDERAAEKCAVIVQRLAATDVPAGDPFRVIVYFLSENLGDKYLNDNLTGTTADIKLLGNFCALIKNIYLRSPADNVNKRINQLIENAAAFKAQGGSSTIADAVSHRLEAFRQYLDNADKYSGKIEPLIANFSKERY